MFMELVFQFKSYFQVWLVLFFMEAVMFQDSGSGAVIDIRNKSCLISIESVHLFRQRRLQEGPGTRPPGPLHHHQHRRYVHPSVHHSSICPCISLSAVHPFDPSIPLFLLTMKHQWWVLPSNVPPDILSLSLRGHWWGGSDQEGGGGEADRRDGQTDAGRARQTGGHHRGVVRVQGGISFCLIDVIINSSLHHGLGEYWILIDFRVSINSW